MAAANASISAKNTTLSVSSTLGGTYTVIAYVHTFSMKKGAGTTDNLYVYGTSTPIVDTSDKTRSIDINGLLNLGDTGGQSALRTAADAGTALFYKLLEDGANGSIQQMTVGSYQEDGDANGTGINRFVRFSCTLTGSGTITDVVGS